MRPSLPALILRAMLLGAPLFGGALSGCDRDSGCVSDCDSARLDDTGVPIYTPVVPTPEWTAPEVGRALTDALAHGFPDGRLLKDTYLAMMAEGDAACPGSDTVITEEFILGCDAASGYFYSGVCVYEEDEIVDEQGTLAYWGIGGDFRLKYPTGAVFEAGGGATYMARRNLDGEQTFQSNLRGTWVDESSPAWLGQGFSGLFELNGGVRRGTSWITAHGGVAIGDTDLFFDELAWDWGGACEGRPTGAVRVRDPRGYWYVWTLDGDCDACGSVLFHGDTDVGELCLDLEPLGTQIFDHLAAP